LRTKLDKSYKEIII